MILYSVVASIVFAPPTGSVTSNADRRVDPELRDRDVANLQLLRTRIASQLPETWPREAGLLALDETLKPLPLRRVAREVPIVIQHSPGRESTTDTTAFMGYGPEDDEQYDPTGAGAKLYYDGLSNPGGVKVNLTRKFAQLCDLLLVVEAAKRRGETFFHGVLIAKLLPGLNALVLTTFGHEAIHAAQYQMRPAYDVDSQRSKIKDGYVPPELLDAARWERAYEREAFAWEYALAIKLKSDLTEGAAAIAELRLRDAPEFVAKNARWEYLADKRRNELVQHYIKDVVEAAERYSKTSTVAWSGVMRFLMDAMVEVPEVTDALADANNGAIEGGPKRIKALRDALTRAERLRRDYYEQGESTERMLASRPFLNDVKLRLDREIERARGRLTGR